MSHEPPAPVAGPAIRDRGHPGGHRGRALAARRCSRGFFPKPIRSLQSALADAADGNLNVRIADRMGPGNDELKDLGVEFDRMISRLRTLIVAQRQLLKDVSHEMRSPIARIQAAIGLADPAARSGAGPDGTHSARIGAHGQVDRRTAGALAPAGECRQSAGRGDRPAANCWPRSSTMRSFEASANGRIIRVVSETRRRGSRKCRAAAPGGGKCGSQRHQIQRSRRRGGGGNGVRRRRPRQPSYRCGTPERGFRNPKSRIFSIRFSAARRMRARRAPGSGWRSRSA